MPAWTEELADFCRIPSEASDIAALAVCCPLDGRAAAPARRDRGRRRAPGSDRRAAARRRRDRRRAEDAEHGPALRRPTGRATRSLDIAGVRTGGARGASLRARRDRQQGRVPLACLGAGGLPRGPRPAALPGPLPRRGRRGGRQRASGCAPRRAAGAPQGRRGAHRGRRRRPPGPAGHHLRRSRRPVRRAHRADPEVRRPLEPGDDPAQRPDPARPRPGQPL